MKARYNVTLWLIVNPTRDYDKPEPETKAVEVQIVADSEMDARAIARSQNQTGLGVWASEAELMEEDWMNSSNEQ